jgi:enamine deaminase RidA (YjgF/YER057c/UK114 family)
VNSTVSSRRVVADVVDGGGLYFARAAAADGWIFLSSPAVGPDGTVPPEATVGHPYSQSPSAHVRAQTRYVFERYRDALESLGSSMADVCQVEQYISSKAHADGYLETSRGPGFLEYERPVSALMQTGDFSPEGVVVVPTGIAVAPRDGLRKEIFSSGIPYVGKGAAEGESYSKGAPFSEIVTAGDYVFNTLWASDYKSGVHPDAKVDPWVWWGNEIRSEARWAGEALRKKLGAVDTDIGGLVNCTVYLIDIADLYELDLVWRELWPDEPPTRTVIPIKGLGSPRWEGVRGHIDGGMKMEIQCRSVKPGVERRVISTGKPQLSHESEGIKAGPLLWISGQMAADANGLASDPDSESQVRYAFDRLAEIAEAGGTSLDNLLRVRAYVTDPDDVYTVHAELRRRVDGEPPCVCVAGVPGPLQVPGCTVTIEAVAFAP